MPKVRVISIKLPPNGQCPPGFQERTTRSGKTCFKVEQAAAAPPMDDLMSMFGNMGIAEKPLVVEIEDNQVNDLMSAFGIMGMGGRSKTRKARKTRRHRKSRK
jgi:hypothetical protein